MNKLCSILDSLDHAPDHCVCHNSMYIIDAVACMYMRCIGTGLNVTLSIAVMPQMDKLSRADSPELHSSLHVPKAIASTLYISLQVIYTRHTRLDG
jgi:hypothetical protein